MGDVCVNPLPTLAFDPLLQMSVWPQKPIFKLFYQKHDVFPENTMFSENREKTRCFSQGTTFLQVLEALGRRKKCKVRVKSVNSGSENPWAHWFHGSVGRFANSGGPFWYTVYPLISRQHASPAPGPPKKESYYVSHQLHSFHRQPQKKREAQKTRFSLV